MGIEDMNNIYKQPQETSPKENQSQDVEKTSVQDNFRNFLKLNGKKLLEHGEGVKLLHDTTDEVIQEINLTLEEQDELKQHIEGYIERNKDRGGLDLLREVSKNSFWKDSAGQEKKAEEERRANLSPEKKLAEDISSANSPVELNLILKNMKSVQGSEQKFSPEDIKNLMKKLVNPDGDVTVMNITRAYGLREKAIDFIEHQISKTNSIDNLRKFLKKLDNLEPSQADKLSKKLDTIESGKYVNPGDGSIDATKANKDQYGIIRRAVELKGLKPKPTDEPWTDLNNPPKGWDPKNP